MKSRDFKEAVEYYNKSLNLDPTEASTYANRAQAYIKLKNFPKCIEDSNKALELQPKYLKALYRRAIAYKETGKFDDAINDLQAILAEEPGSKKANEELENVRLMKNEKTEELPSQYKKMTIEEVEEDIKVTEITDDKPPADEPVIEDEEGSKPAPPPAEPKKEEPKKEEPKKEEYQELEVEEEDSEDEEDKETETTEAPKSEVKDEVPKPGEPTKDEKKQEDKPPVKVEPPKKHEPTEEELEEIERFGDLKAKVDEIKNNAKNEYQKGMHLEAVSLYKSGAKLVESNEKNYSYKLNDLITLKAQLWNNIAFCYKQSHDSDMEI